MSLPDTHPKPNDAQQPSPEGLAAMPCSAATVREALQRCATMDDGWAAGRLIDAEKCEQSDSPAIRARAQEMRTRAEEYKLRAARYRAALAWLVG